MSFDQRSKIAILGFGVEGREMFEYLVKHGYTELTVCDENVDLKDEMPDGVSVRLGPDYLAGLEDFDVVFRTPGIRFLDPVIQGALAKGVEVTSQTKYFIEHCPCDIIGVTGTKGKGTTATLIYEMLKKGGKKAYLGGNIGVPPISFIDKLKGDHIVVLELSSFQLQDLKNSPKYAVLLNTTSDHLDYHADRDEYMHAKESLISHQKKDSVAVLNKDYDYVEYYLQLVRGNLRLMSVREKVKDGAYLDEDVIKYVKNGKEEEICSTKDIALTGAHNVENVLPAVVIAMELQVKKSALVSVIKSFKGLPHRLEFVKEVKGVRFYNDSFSTTPETSMAAVDSFDDPTVLIAGGFDKGLDYEDWAVKILTKPSLEAVVLVGDNADLLEEDLEEGIEKLGEAEGSPTRILKRDSLEEAVETAFGEAKKGGVVVMSPGSSSFDMHKNYKERGKRFREIVEGL